MPEILHPEHPPLSPEHEPISRQAYALTHYPPHTLTTEQLATGTVRGIKYSVKQLVSSMRPSTLRRPCRATPGWESAQHPSLLPPPAPAT
eukprot:9478245-Pyramimonas_sp.AAC.1